MSVFSSLILYFINAILNSMQNNKIGQINLYKSGINKLIKWLNSKNWHIEFGFYEDEISLYDKSITINHKNKIENQLYAILHECGHMVLFLNKKYPEKYSYIYKVDLFLNKNKSMTKSKRYQVETISEEIEAWHRGFNLAKRLNIYINIDNYKKEASKYIWSYIEEACIIKNHVRKK